jgi:DMSO/TMAO reductase YedYZ molybdopterin-dependent catalytic subunit
MFKGCCFPSTLWKGMDKRRVFEITVAVGIIFLITMTIFAAALIPQPKKLYPNEIRDYKGQNLSSIGDFAENSIAGPQDINASTYRLQITGLVNHTIQYTYNDVLTRFQSYEKVVTLQCVDGWSVKILWEGVLLSDVIKDAGVSPDAVAIIFHAADGYTTSLTLDYITSNNIMIAYKMNGLTLPPERGFPFQLVAESQYGYKWIKWITQIHLTSNPDFLGSWERAGYPNNATITR